MTLDPRRSVPLCPLLGAWLTLLPLSFFPLWTTVNEESGVLILTERGSLWEVMADVRAGLHTRGEAIEVLLRRHAGNIRTTVVILLSGGLAGWLAQQYHLRNER